MLSISQTSRGFFCIEWISTEKGPRIINSEYLNFNLNFKDENDLFNLFESFKSKSKSKSLSIVLNSDQFLISKIEVLKSETRNKEIINWHENNVLGNQFCKDHYNYYFPIFSDESYNYMSLYLSKKVKNNILKASKKLGYDLRYLSVDIFSAAIGAKQIYFNQIKNEYIIWKICKGNKHKIVLYDLNKIKAYAELYKKNNKYEQRFFIGNKIYEELLVNCVNEILINKSNFHRFSNIYVYQTKQARNDLDRIIDMNFKNIKILSFNNLFATYDDLDLLKYMPFVENGITFKGLDV